MEYAIFSHVLAVSECHPCVKGKDVPLSFQSRIPKFYLMFPPTAHWVSKVRGLYQNCGMQNICHVFKCILFFFTRWCYCWLLCMGILLFLTLLNSKTLYLTDIISPFHTLFYEDNFEFWSYSPACIHFLPSSWAIHMSIKMLFWSVRSSVKTIKVNVLKQSLN